MQKRQQKFVRNSTLFKLLMSVNLLTLGSPLSLRASTSSTDPEIREAARISDFEKVLKEIYPEATRFEEKTFLPLETGGTSLVGLVARLLGEGVNKDLEGLKTRRYMYHAFKNKERVGVAHVSSSYLDSSTKGELVDVAVFFDQIGQLKEVRPLNLPQNVRVYFSDNKTLKQFEGLQLSDFTIERGRKNRIKSKGRFFSIVKKPGQDVARRYFDKITRAVQFNVAFMDVAHFITQHPDMAHHHQEEFPEQIEVKKGMPKSGPEARAQAAAQGSPLEGNPFPQLLNDPNKPDGKSN